MIDETTLAQMNGKYVMPSDAGPAWRAAHDAGIDMSLIEENLMRSPWERLVANDRALSLVRTLEQAGRVTDGIAH
jgi:hypothetical protein